MFFLGDYFQPQIQCTQSIYDSRTLPVGSTQYKVQCPCSSWWKNMSLNAWVLLCDVILIVFEQQRSSIAQRNQLFFRLWMQRQYLLLLLLVLVFSLDPAQLCSVYISHLLHAAHTLSSQTCQLDRSREDTDEAGGPKSPTSPTVASCKNKSRKQESSERTDI